MTERIDSARFFLKSVFDHCVDAPVYSLEKLFARPVDCEHGGFEVAMFSLAGAKRGEWNACFTAYFYCVDQTLMVVEIYFAVVDGVEFEQFEPQALQAALLVEFPCASAVFFADCWELVDYAHEGVDVKNLTAYYYW